jgi:hypothetical protein
MCGQDLDFGAGLCAECGYFHHGRRHPSGRIFLPFDEILRD